MTMHNPPHPGEFIKATYLDTFSVSQNDIADQLDVAKSTFNRLIRGDSGISPEMALKLSKVLGRTPESWLTLQANFDLHAAKKKKSIFSHLKKFKFPEVPSFGFNLQPYHARA